MCRSLAEGGRRCPSCRSPYHTAWRRAAYAATRLSERFERVELPERPEPEVLELLSPEAVRAAVEAARAVVARMDEPGGPEPAAVERTVTAAGRAIAAWADATVVATVASIEAEAAADPDLAEALGPGGLLATIQQLREQRERLIGEIVWHSYGTPERRRLAQELQGVSGRLRQLSDSTYASRLFQAEREATWGVLRSLRDFGPDGPLDTATGSNQAAVSALEAAAAFYPTDWVRASNELRPRVLVKLTMQRAHYVEERVRRPRSRASADESSPAVLEPMVSEITLPRPTAVEPAETLAVAAHEFGHRCEHAMGRIGRLERAFLARRTGGGDPGRPAKTVPLSSGGRAWPDHFVDAYVGKIYSGTPIYTEVLSVGMEALVGGRYGGLSGLGNQEPDHDHRAFVLGLLACA